MKNKLQNYHVELAIFMIRFCSLCSVFPHSRVKEQGKERDENRVNFDTVWPAL